MFVCFVNNVLKIYQKHQIIIRRGKKLKCNLIVKSRNHITNVANS